MKKVLRYIVIGAISLPLLYGVWLLLRVFLFDFFSIPTYSMYPTLKPGDEVIVNKMLMGARIYKDFHFDKKGIELKSWRTRGLRPIRHVMFSILIMNSVAPFLNNLTARKYGYGKKAGRPADAVSKEAK